MRVVETGDNERVRLVLDIVRDISKASAPGDVIKAFGSRYWRLRSSDMFISISRRGLDNGRFKITRNMRIADFIAGRLYAGLDPYTDWNSMPAREGGFIGEMIKSSEPKMVFDLDLKHDPVLGDQLAEMGSCIVNPLFTEGEATHWSFTFRRGKEAFTVDDLEQMVLVGNLVGGQNGRVVLINEVKKLNAQLTAQFEEVARVQRALLPQKIPDIPGLAIATSYLTSDQAGGDYYDFYPMRDGRWGIMIADVSGHGPAAATVMAMLHAIVHGFPGPDEGPEAVLKYANARLCQSRIEGNFVTAFFAIYDPAQATLTYSRAGHNPPRLKRGPYGAVEELDKAGTLPLGLIDPMEATSVTVKLEPEDTVILYTDGITEAFDHRRAMFGTERLDAALIQCSGAPDCVIDSVHTALYQHTGERTRADDQTLVALRYTGPKR